MNTIALSPESFIFAQGEELKTTSLNISKAFGKRHDHVLRDVKKIIASIAGLDHAPKFGETAIERDNPSGGLPISSPAYEMDKDGFMLVVMGYTGEKAMAIKVAYINAFNLMHDKLFPKTQYGLKQLQAPRAKTYIKGGLELHQQDAINDFIKERVAIVPEHKRKGITVMIYSAICIKFDVKGMTHGYKNIVPEQFDNIIQLIARLPIHDEKAMLFFTQDELDALVAERVKAIEGEVMPNEVTNSITINLAPLVNKKSKRWLITQSCDEMAVLMSIGDDQEVMNREGMIRELRHDSNYIVFDKTGLSVRQMVMHHIPPQFLPDMIEEAWAMLRRTDAGKLQA